MAWNNDSWAKKILKTLQEQIANFSRFLVKGVGLQPLACWNCGPKSLQGVWGEGGCLYFVNVVCCHVEVSATGWSLVQRSSTGCCMCSRNLNIEEAQAHWNSQAIKKKEQTVYCHVVLQMHMPNEQGRFEIAQTMRLHGASIFGRPF